MFAQSLELKDFRNYKKASVTFSPGLNIVSGENAQGKTTLLEAVYLSGVGRSPRTPRDKELISHGQSRAGVKITAKSKAGSQSVEIILDKTENKRVAINRMPALKIGELMGVVPVVFFSPTEIKVAAGAPGERRSFMDIALSQMSRTYFYLLQRYDKILSQRNRLLKSGKHNGDVLDVWDAQLAESGSKIIRSRKGFIAKLTGFAKEHHAYLSGGKETLELSYDGLEGESAEEINEIFLKALRTMRNKDIESGYTHLGPQKDDIALKVNGTDLRSFGSQGQLRTAALALKLSGVDLHHTQTGEYPVLLLDDVLSELDQNRQRLLLDRVKNIQAILTCTHVEDGLLSGLDEYKKFTVKNGEIFA